MRFSSNVLTLLGQDAITTILQMALSIYVARVLGPAQMGILVILLAITQYADKFGRLKMEDAAVYLLKKKECSLSQANTHLLWLAIPQFIVLVLALLLLKEFIFSLFFQNQQIPLSWYYLALGHIPITFFLMNIRKLALAVDAITIYNKTFWRIPAIQLAILPVVAFGIGHLDLGWVLIASLAAQGIVIAIAQCHLRALDPKPVNAFQWSLAKKLFSWGIQFYSSTVPSYLQLRLDLMMIAYFLNPKQAAFYSLATTASELLWKLPNAVQNLLFPVSTSMPDGDAGQFTLNSCRRLLIALIVLALMGAIAIYPAVYLLYGATYLPLVWSFMLLLPGTLAMGLGKVATSYLQGRGLVRKVAITQSVTFIFNILLNLAAIPIWQARGAALSSSITYSISTALLTHLFLRNAKKRWRDLWPAHQDYAFYPQRLKEWFSR